VDQRLVEAAPGAVPVDVFEHGLPAEVGVAQAALELALLALVHSASTSRPRRSSKLSAVNSGLPSWRWQASAKAGRRRAISLSMVG
jgi:hypothetical protein